MGQQAVIRDSDVIDGLSNWFLKFFGLWNAINKFRRTGKQSGVIRFHAFMTVIIAGSYASFQLPSFFIIKYDIRKVTFLYLQGLPPICICYRILIICYRMDSLSRLYDLMRNDFFNIPEHIRATVREQYKKYSSMSNGFILFFFIWNAGLAMLYLFFPRMSIDYILYHTGSMSDIKTGRRKILSGWYPVPMGEFPYYEIIFVYESICLLWLTTLLTVTFCVFFQILMCMYAQYEILGYRLSILKVNNADSGTRNKYIQEKNSISRLYIELNEILQEHQKLLRYTKELRSMFNPLVTLSLLIGVIVLINGAVQILIGNANDAGTIFQIIQVFALEIMEVSLFCLGSSLIGTASSDLQFAIYCSDWYKADVKFRKAAQMLMVRSTRDSSLTAIIYPVTLEALAAILNFTYSATAVTIGMVE